MRIVIDAQLPFAAETFSGLGDVVSVPVDDLTVAVRDADALVVRSVTRVGESLLAGSRVRFVGSATSGTDHVDLAYLRRAGIGFADAAGCNAVAVAEYVAAALFHLRSTHGIPFDGRSIGIIGCGHVGRAVSRFAAALGMRVVVHDPPLARATCEPVYRPLPEALASDFVSLHVPLERAGLDPTHHLANAAFFAGMKPGAVLLNASRGAVVDPGALKSALSSRHLRACVLDVWENEPHIDPELFEMWALGTAHIAGHTLDAKRRAVDMLREALVQHFNESPKSGSRNAGLGVENHLMIESDASKLDAIESAVRASFDIVAESDRLRAAMRGDSNGRAHGFDALRSSRPTRREFGATAVRIDPGHPAADVLRTLGFAITARVATPSPSGAR